MVKSLERLCHLLTFIHGCQTKMETMDKEMFHSSLQDTSWNEGAFCWKSIHFAFSSVQSLSRVRLFAIRNENTYLASYWLWKQRTTRNRTSNRSSVYNNPAWVLWWQSVQTCCGERGLCLDIYSCCFEEFFLTWQIRQSRQTPGSRAMDYFSLHYPPWAESLTWGSCLIPVFWTSDCWVDCALSLW